MVKGECPRCHAVNQLSLQFDPLLKLWELYCITCSYSYPAPANLVAILEMDKDARKAYSLPPTTFESNLMCSTTWGLIQPAQTKLSYYKTRL